MPPIIHLASGNLNKVREIQRMATAHALPVEFAATVNPPDVVEDTGTFAGNALKKARAFQAVLPPGAWVLADDSGLCVDELHDGPGVESAYYAGPQHDSIANLLKLAWVMQAVPLERRGAYYICVLVLLAPDGTHHTFEGRCEGVLSRVPVGSGGFGYDPLFIPNGYAKTCAELDADVKNRISHRGRAFAGLAQWLAAQS